MKLKFFALLGCFLLLFGCGTADEDNSTGSDNAPSTDNAEDEEAVEDLTGHIISISNEGNIRILVTGSQANSSGVSATMYTLEESTKVSDTDGKAMDAADLKIGMKVTVWNTGIVAESFPAQSGALKVVVDAGQDDREQAAIEKALSDVKAGDPWHVEAVEEIKESHYKVTLKNLLEDSEPVEVEVQL
ncbi:YobA family protein [Bacillus tianshenii]|uniref:DUF3221 domain-containing protein n=1 Tax=Sutcliffiella tianshenii TaxID=1463404 RepID=UPI001CD294A7|nr:DUF3221 domain-containing protein [Bacillus tianshenii]MCA1322412.1 YobA family protein [Bacillus tianshenii]